MATMQSTSMYKNMGTNQSAQNMKNAADKIPDTNVYTKMAKAAIKATAEFYSSQAQRRQLEAQADAYHYEAQTALMNASLSQLDKSYLEISLKTNDYAIRNATQEVYNQYRMGEYQAMQQGLQDAQVIHHQRAQTASSGVRMDSASKQEVDETNRISAKLNQYAIQMNTWSNARQAQQAVRQAENQGQAIKKQMYDIDMQTANYMAQSYIAQGNEQASNIMAKSIKPLFNAVVEFGMSMASSNQGWNWPGGKSLFGGSSSSSSSLGGYGAGWSSDGNTWDYTNFTSSLKNLY